MSTSDNSDLPPRPRPWWKDPRYAAIAVAVVALLGAGGYFGVNALLPHTSKPPPPPPPLVHVNGLPPGATHCEAVYHHLLTPFNASARGTPMTSCPFAEQVRMEYARHSSSTSGAVPLRVVSPTTELPYDVTCLTTGDYATCSGGAAAVIYLYNGPQR
jgi:hypothetical protein